MFKIRFIKKKNFGIRSTTWLVGRSGGPRSGTSILLPADQSWKYIQSIWWCKQTKDEKIRNIYINHAIRPNLKYTPFIFLLLQADQSCNYNLYAAASRTAEINVICELLQADQDLGYLIPITVKDIYPLPPSHSHVHILE